MIMQAERVCFVSADAVKGSRIQTDGGIKEHMGGQVLLVLCYF